MLATTSQHPSTARVTLPKVSVENFRQLIGLALGQHPDEAKRLKNGVATLLGSAIFETDEVGTYLIESCSVPGTYHRARSAECSCADRQRRGVRCRHMWALTFLFAVSAEARYEWMKACYERNKAQGAA